jgi:hypothetical protein
LLNDTSIVVRASQAALLSPVIALYVTMLLLLLPLLLLLFFIQGPEFAYWWARIDDCMGKWQQLQQVRVGLRMSCRAAAAANNVAAAAAALWQHHGISDCMCCRCGSSSSGSTLMTAWASGSSSGFDVRVHVVFGCSSSSSKCY